MTHTLYLIENTVTGEEYIGITKNLKQRVSAHLSKSRNNPRTHLYRSMSKYGSDSFVFTAICKGSEEYIVGLEKVWIAVFQPTYNVSSGGEVGGAVPQFKHEQWVGKLKAARAGRTPALNMRHTDENKKLFSECGKKRWDICGRYPDCVIDIPFKDANTKYGISRTHYYRLKKQ